MSQVAQFKAKAENQMGNRLIIKNPNDGGVLFNELQWALKKEIRENGDICAWYEANNNYMSIQIHDVLDYLSKFYHHKFEYRVEEGCRLIDEVEGWAETFAKMQQEMYETAKRDAEEQGKEVEDDWDTYENDSECVELGRNEIGTEIFDFEY